MKISNQLSVVLGRDCTIYTCHRDVRVDVDNVSAFWNAYTFNSCCASWALGAALSERAGFQVHLQSYLSIAEFGITESSI